MKTFTMPGTDLTAARIALGCMRISRKTEAEIDNYLNTALECGYNFFDHADIYGGGTCEEVFGKALRRNGIARDSILIQSKCGIRKGMFDFSKEHILNSVDGILKRLNVDYLDTLLLHRPDTLMEPEEVGEAFDTLASAGKVRYFGVSNMNSLQMELLQSGLSMKLVANQLQFSPAHTPMIDAGLNVNMVDEPAIVRDGGVLEYCRLHKITIQPWSPFQYGYFEGLFLGSEKYAELTKVVNELAEKYSVSDSAIVVAWILRHPAQMQPIIGSASADRIRGIAAAAEITLSREEWYKIYLAAGNRLP